MIVLDKVIETDGVVISGQLYLPGEGSGYPVVCICHGIPSGQPPDPGDRGYPALAERVCGEGLAAFIFNFRGTGFSSGNIDMAGWVDDLRAVVNYLITVPQLDKDRLFLLGYSAGAAVSICLASGDSCVAGVIAGASPADFNDFLRSNEPSALVEHFRSIGAIRDEDFPQDTQDWLDGFRLVNPAACVDGIAPRPLLLLHGGRDETVPVSHARRLYDAADEPKELIILEGTGHRLRREEAAVLAILAWLKARLEN